jgi:hypothetical protein
VPALAGEPVAEAPPPKIEPGTPEWFDAEVERMWAAECASVPGVRFYPAAGGGNGAVSRAVRSWTPASGTRAGAAGTNTEEWWWPGDSASGK